MAVQNRLQTPEEEDGGEIDRLPAYNAGGETPDPWITYDTGLPTVAEEETSDAIRELMETPSGCEQPLDIGVRVMGDFVPMGDYKRREIHLLDDPVVCNTLYGSYRDEGMPHISGSIGRVGEENPIPNSSHLYEDIALFGSDSE
jgi:hypothetical protein